MRRIVAPAGAVISTMVNFDRWSFPYLVNSILKLGQSITHLCKLPRVAGGKCCDGLPKLSALMPASLYPTQSGRGA